MDVLLLTAGSVFTGFMITALSHRWVGDAESKVRTEERIRMSMTEQVAIAKALHGVDEQTRHHRQEILDRYVEYFYRLDKPRPGRSILVPKGTVYTATPVPEIPEPMPGVTQAELDALTDEDLAWFAAHGAEDLVRRARHGSGDEDHPVKLGPWGPNTID